MKLPEKLPPVLNYFLPAEEQWYKDNYIYQQALGRIAELEETLAQAETRAEVAIGAYNTCYERGKELEQKLADLEAKLALFVDKIPEGKYCKNCYMMGGNDWDSVDVWCRLTSVDCIRENRAWLKHSSCPKYKEAE